MAGKKFVVRPQTQTKEEPRKGFFYMVDPHGVTHPLEDGSVKSQNKVARKLNQ